MDVNIFSLFVVIITFGLGPVASCIFKNGKISNQRKYQVLSNDALHLHDVCNLILSHVFISISSMYNS